MAHIVIPAEDMIRLNPDEQMSIGPTLAELAARCGIGLPLTADEQIRATSVLPPPTSSHYLCTIGEFAARHASSQGGTALDGRAPLLVHSTGPYKEILMSQLQTIQLRPGDILVVTAPTGVAKANIKDELAKVLPAGARVAVLPEGTELMTISPAGWVGEAKTDQKDEPVKCNTAPNNSWAAFYGPLPAVPVTPQAMRVDPEIGIAVGAQAERLLMPAVCGACHNGEHALCDGTCYCGCATNRARKTPAKATAIACSDQHLPYICTACVCGDHELCDASAAINCVCFVCATNKAKAKAKPVTSPFFK